MAREIVEPTLDKYGAEEHPAWALIGAIRVASTPGAVLFDSDVRHSHLVVVRLQRARRKRELHRDWIGGGQQIIEIAMSEAQWASFVSSFGIGDGVPCTIRAESTNWEVPGFPYEPRLQESMDEVRGAASKAAEEIKAAFEAYEQKKSAENLRTLKYAIANMPANVAFAGETLVEHAENVVEKARADIEAMVVQTARQVGLDPGELGTLELTTGE